jgi:NAD(P)-dependent dehydrogenase (short-subunit alcohol dehydrogenase family)
MKPLDGTVAVVAGATRGAGRGIAVALGEAGATVYCCGRSTRGHAASEGRPETIDETAERVTAAGGRGIAVQCDHTDEAQVRALFGNVRANHGGLDLLVNDVWGGDALTEWSVPFWEMDLAKARTLLDRAIWSHIVTARHGLPLLIARGRGLLVEVTDGDFAGWRGTFFYDLVKSSVIRIAYSLSRELELRGHDAITALAVTPGFLRSEAMLDLFGVTAETWRDAAKKDRHFLHSETPTYVGRAIAALAADPNVHAKAGKTWASWTLAREYGFTDTDGTRPDWGAYFDGEIARILASPPFSDEDRELLKIRSYQLDLDPARADELARIRDAVRSSASPRSAP